MPADGEAADGEADVGEETNGEGEIFPKFEVPLESRAALGAGDALDFDTEVLVVGTEGAIFFGGG